MSGFARPGPLGDLDRPQCACSAPMRLATIEPLLKDANTEIHTFECVNCGLSLRVMHSHVQAA